MRPLCAGRWVFCAAFVSRSALRVSRAAPTASRAASLAALTASLAASLAALTADLTADLIGAQGGPTEREDRGGFPMRGESHAM